MRHGLVVLSLGLALAAAGSASAQSGYTYSSGVRAQMDRPGDFRCDAFWDANRTDCDARWRDQRDRTSWNSGSTRRYDSHGYDHGYRAPRGYGQSQGGSAYYGAYGRPDLVYPGGGQSQGGYGQGGHGQGGHGQGGYVQGGAREPHRIDWCRSTYRSYDPASGYYRAYSGRLVWCG
ncbi:hypothetical protein GVN24_20260 [Rhizobium sp. CRIBSB]|nr:hypothetical protein [Rhizobium sp. CRIBSB]